MPAGPLAGVKIIDLTSVMMGPYATMLLGDYGADVIKVESPEGDVMRHAAPMKHPRMGAMYLQGNRNKRSIVLDLKKPGGRAALLRLAEQADVFVHNVRPAAMARLKLGADDLLAVNPRLVYASLHGFGEKGPYAGRPAYDDLIQGLTALPALTGRITGEPRYSPATMADRIVGLNAAHAILAALFHRERTGEGQAIEIPMFETMAQFVLGDHMAGRSFEPPIGPAGYSRLLSPDRRPYQTSDGFICALVYSDKQWNAFFHAIGQDDEGKRDPRLNSISARARNYDFVYDWFSQVMKTKTTAEWLSFFAEADIPHAPLHDLDSLIDDPHLAAVGLIHSIAHPTEGTLRLAGPAATWSKTPPSIRHHPPGVGEHGREILRDAGFAEDEIVALAAEGALIDPDTES
jgi:crotonobetainyl-CoA:carnitine CoA-transferase CaiB-like acyl-CoA transferase